MARRSHEEERTVHITARVPVELAEEFERVANEEDRSISAELRRAMRRHIEHRDALGGAGPRFASA
jgi:hypothetical protein